jgi:putative ABC transport system ATP-binding protein
VREPAPVLELVEASRVHGAGTGTEVTAVRQVSLQVHRGEFLAVVGPSGSGKSTLLQLLGLLDRPTGGTVRIEGRDAGTLSDRERTLLRRDRLGFVFQFFNLLDLLTAAENVALPLYLAGAPRAVADARARLLLEQVGLTPRARHRPPALSGGERQRLAVARALAGRPAAILADEPTGNLDRAAGRRVLDLLGQLVEQEHVALVVVTHDLEAATRAHRTVELVDGRVRAPA